MKSRLVEILDDLKEENISLFGGITVLTGAGYTRLYFSGGSATFEIIANKPLADILKGASASVSVRITS